MRSFHILVFILGTLLNLQAQMVLIQGEVLDEETKLPVIGASIRISGSTVGAETNHLGQFSFHLIKRSNYPLQIRQLAYQYKTEKINNSPSDIIKVQIYLRQKVNVLLSVDVSATQKPETLVGKANYSVYDFDFIDPYFLLLTANKSLKSATVQIASYEGQIVDTWKVPLQAGEAVGFYRDYEGYTELICKDSVFRIDVFQSQISISTIRKNDFEKSLKPIADTLHAAYLWSDGWESYPQMHYFSWKKNDSLSKLIKSITNRDLLQLYNMEYYFLPSRSQLEARRLAKDYKTDVHIVAALMSGFTKSMFYEPLYAPLFVIRDTICIFDHHSDYLFHFDKNSQLIDSVNISYHHPQKWNDWKKKLLVDDAQANVFAYYSHDGHHYLKQIHPQTGQILSTYKLQNHSAEKIKIRDGFVYYVYRPFESTQEKFLYREKIR